MRPPTFLRSHTPLELAVPLHGPRPESAVAQVVRQHVAAMKTSRNFLIVAAAIVAVFAVNCYSFAQNISTNQTVNLGDARLLGDDTNVIPLIQFDDFPLTECLEHLAKQAGINYVLDPEIGYGMPDKFGKIKTEPILSLHWENLTAKQAFIAVCEIYKIVIIKSTNSSTGVLLTQPEGGFSQSTENAPAAGGHTLALAPYEAGSIKMAGITLFCLGMLVWFVGNLMFLAVVFRYSLIWFFGCLFVPLLDWVYFAFNLKRTWKPTLIATVGCLIAGAGYWLAGFKF
jgi:hypothetical protein